MSIAYWLNRHNAKVREELLEQGREIGRKEAQAREEARKQGREEGIREGYALGYADAKNGRLRRMGPGPAANDSDRTSTRTPRSRRLLR